jgi:putative hemolysin
VAPHVPFPIHDLHAEQPVQVPALLKGYMRSGAWICGDPAWDADFNSADLFLLLPLDRLDERYARRYMKDGSAA